MKKAVVVFLALFLLLTATCWAQEAPKGKDVTITGHMSCTFCNLATGKPCTKECCVACVKEGDPASLTDEKGNIYILLTGEKAKPLMNPERMGLLGGKVKVTGTMVQRGGIQAIYVKKLEKAQ